MCIYVYLPSNGFTSTALEFSASKQDTGPDDVSFRVMGLESLSSVCILGHEGHPLAQESKPEAIPVILAIPKCACDLLASAADCYRLTLFVGRALLE